jgi:hypothetical protein
MKQQIGWVIQIQILIGKFYNKKVYQMQRRRRSLPLTLAGKTMTVQPSTQIYFDVVKLDAVSTAPFSVSPILVECIRPVTQKQVVELLRQQTIVPPHSPIFMLRESWVDLEQEPANILDVDKLRARVVLLEGDESICTWQHLLNVWRTVSRLSLLQSS